MHATIAQQPGKLGAQAVAEAAKPINGETPTAIIPVEVITVGKDNVEEFA